MTPQEILSRMHALDVTLRADGDALHYAGPAGALDADMRAAITGQRAALLALLTQDTQADDDPASLSQNRATLQHVASNDAATRDIEPVDSVAVGSEGTATVTHHCNGEGPGDRGEVLQSRSDGNTRAMVPATLLAGQRVGQPEMQPAVTDNRCSVARVSALEEMTILEMPAHAAPVCQSCRLRPSPCPPHGRCRECITAAWHPVPVPLTCAACGGQRWHLWQHADTGTFEWMCAACRPLVQIVSDGREVR